MSTVHELRQLLSSLVESWPGDHSHPTVQQAREYLESNPTLSINTDLLDGYSHWAAQDEDSHNSAWYSV